MTVMKPTEELRWLERSGKDVLQQKYVQVRTIDAPRCVAMAPEVEWRDVPKAVTYKDVELTFEEECDKLKFQIENKLCAAIKPQEIIMTCIQCFCWAIDLMKAYIPK